MSYNYSRRGGDDRQGKENYHRSDRGQDHDIDSDERRQQDRGRYQSSDRGGRGGGYRGGRGDRYQSSYGERRGGFGRGRGDYHDQSGRDSQSAVETLDCNSMFEVLDNKSLTPTDNEVIAGCGEKYGSFGAPTSLTTNYFHVQSLPSCTIHQYSVTFEPAIESYKLKSGLLKSQKDIIKTVHAFDGSLLFLPYKINDATYDVKTNKGEEIKMTVKHVSIIGPGSPTSVMVFNLIVRRVMKMLQMKQIKRHHFDPNEAKVIERCGLEVWPGISGALTFFNNMAMYCVDVSHHVMRSVSVLDHMRSLLNQGHQASRNEIEKSLLGQIILTRYNNRTYKIDGIVWDLNPTSSFTLKNGESVKYADYYSTHHGIKITDLGQPLILSKMKERRAKHEDKLAKIKGEMRQEVENNVHLVPELCYITGISDDIRSDFNTMKELARFTKMSPTSRCNGVYGFLKRIDACSEASNFLQNWGVEFNKKLVSIPSRKYPAEKIYFEDVNRPYEYTDKDADWTMAFRNNRLMNPVPLKKWFVFYGERDYNMACDFIDALCMACRELGFSVDDPELIQVQNLRPQELCKSMKVLYNNPDIELAMFILPPNRKELYNAVKTVCCIERPIPSQVVLTKTLSRKNVMRSVAIKVAIQMCAKLGGEPWSVNIPSKNKMVVGIDVCHEVGRTTNSWLGFVASLNDNFTRYYSRTTRQPSRTEIVDSLFANMKIALEQYYKMNQRMPDSVIVFRDGVGDGQVEMVQKHEITSMEECLKSVCRPHGEVPTFAYVIVRKRISTRLFVMNNSCAVNPTPGAIVDRVVTRDEFPNFYLVSQSIREGTVNPTHYIIVSNNTRLSTNLIQRLSYKLCHLYFNWSGTIRVPAPCQYAHKLCFLVSQCLGQEPSSALSNKLYYL